MPRSVVRGCLPHLGRVRVRRRLRPEHAAALSRARTGERPLASPRLAAPARAAPVPDRLRHARLSTPDRAGRAIRGSAAEARCGGRRSCSLPSARISPRATRAGKPMGRGFRPRWRSCGGSLAGRAWRMTSLAAMSARPRMSTRPPISLTPHPGYSGAASWRRTEILNEGRHPCGRPRQPALGGDRAQAQAHGGDRRAADPVAHHEDLRRPRVQRFVICCGYKGYVIKEYFANYFLHNSDVTFDLRDDEHGSPPEHGGAVDASRWSTPATRP